MDVGEHLAPSKAEKKRLTKRSNNSDTGEHLRFRSDL